MREQEAITPRKYPKPKVPVLPVLSWRTFGIGQGLHYPNILDVGASIPVASGSAAIALALRHAGINEHHKVLLPAYHCRSMIEPVLAVKATPVYFKINSDTSVDFDDLVSRTDDITRAIVLPHFFGIPQDVERIRKYCDAKGLVMIEDCAHMFFGTSAGHPIGWYGDYAIASTRKFFPVFEGGHLVSSRKILTDIPVKPASPIFSAKTMINALEESFQYNRLQPLGLCFYLPLYFKNSILKALRRGYFKQGSLRSTRSTKKNHNLLSKPGEQQEYEYININNLNRRLSVPSRWLIKLTSRKRIIKERQLFFNRLATALTGFANARPLISRLPGDVAPYMFPLIIDEPEKVFPVLKNKGVPIWRWEELETDRCEISRNYSRTLFQIPCHQELRSREIDWIIKCITEVLAESNRKTSAGRQILINNEL